MDATLFFVSSIFFFFLLYLLHPQFWNNPSSLMFLVSLSFFSSILSPSLLPWLPLPCCLSPHSLPGVVAMAREPAQMAGQLAFRGRAPQLKLPPFFLFSSSLFFSSNFWPATFHVWRAFISACMMWGGRQGPQRGWDLSNTWFVLRSVGAIRISGNPAESPECQWVSVLWGHWLADNLTLEIVAF